MGGEISAGDLLTKHKLKNTDATSHLHIDWRNIPSAAQINVVANKEKINKEATVCWKDPEAKKLRFARSFDRAGIAWLLVEGSKSSFISWSKLNITWLGKRYVQIMCSSGIQNKLIRVEKNPLPSRPLFSAVPPPSNNNCSHFKRKIV